MKPLGPPPPEPDGQTVDEFCNSNRVSRTQLYDFWKGGIGPGYFWNGTRRIIPREASADWRRKRMAEAALQHEYEHRVRQGIANAPDREAAREIYKREAEELRKYPALIEELASLYGELREEATA